MQSVLSLLLRPRILSTLQSIRPGKKKKNRWRIIIFVFVGAAFWLGSFIIFFRVLNYFQSVEEFGDILALRLLSMIVITFFTLLLFSNIINSLAHLYLSRDLPLLHSLPVPDKDIFFSRWLISAFDSSWMVILFSFPVFLSYGLTYQAGAGFYLMASAGIVFLCLIAAAVSSILVMLGAVILPAGKIRSLFIVLGVALAILLVVVLRIIRPEQLVNPQTFASVVVYLNSLQALDAAYLPTTWISDVVRAALKSDWNFSLFSLALSASFASFLMFINESIAKASYFRGFSRAQTTAKRLSYRISFRNHGWESLLNFLTPPAKALVVKEIKSFFRDSTQWPQLFLICALIVIYLYNFSVLPLDKPPVSMIYLQNVFSFLNMGLAAFVLSAIAARFVFPAVSMESEAFWIIQAAPVSMRTFLWTKFFLYYIPLLIVSETLIIVSNLLLGVTPFIMALSIITMFCLVPAIVAMAIGLGARYSDFKSENPAMTTTSFGGLLFMLCSFGLIAAVIALEAGPVYYTFMADVHGRNLSFIQLIRLIASFFLALLFCVFAVYYPMRLGEKHLKKT